MIACLFGLSLTITACRFTPKLHGLHGWAWGIGIGEDKEPVYVDSNWQWWNEKDQRVEMRCSLVGKKRGQLKPDTWYQLDEKGEFQKCKI